MTIIAGFSSSRQGSAPLNLAAQFSRTTGEKVVATAIVERALPAGASAKPVRFAAKGLRAQRKRLGLSAADFGRLVGVSSQSIYNWEQESARPREEQIAKLVQLRALGKREARERVTEQVGTKVKARRRRS